MQARDIMSVNVVCIGVAESVFDAAELLLGARVSAAPVVNDKGTVVGIVSEADLLRRAEIGPDTELRDLVDLMERHGVKRIPIVDDGTLAGVVSRADLLRALLSREPEGPVLQPTDRALRELVIAALEKKPWSSRWPINVFANDGVVHLWGFVENEEVLKACRVAAENVPGVRKVKNHLRRMPASVGFGT